MIPVPVFCLGMNISNSDWNKGRGARGVIRSGRRAQSTEEEAEGRGRGAWSREQKSAQALQDVAFFGILSFSEGFSEGLALVS